MKKYLFLSMAAIAALFTFASCGDDDEIEPDDINLEDVKVDKAKFTETTNQMVLTYTISFPGLSSEKVNVKHTVGFQGDACSSFITEYTYSKEFYAKQSYEDAMANKDEDDLTVYSYKGKVYKEDETAYYKGQSKDEIREYLKFLEGSIK